MEQLSTAEVHPFIEEQGPRPDMSFGQIASFAHAVPPQVTSHAQAVSHVTVAHAFGPVQSTWHAPPPQITSPQAPGAPHVTSQGPPVQATLAQALSAPHVTLQNPWQLRSGHALMPSQTTSAPLTPAFTISVVHALASHQTWQLASPRGQSTVATSGAFPQLLRALQRISQPVASVQSTPPLQLFSPSHSTRQGIDAGQ